MLVETQNSFLKRDSSLPKMLQKQRSVEAFKVKHLPQIVELISKENWTGLREYLSKEDVTSYPVKSVDDVDDGGHHILHLVCRMRPPVDIVHKLVELAPQGVKVMNARGQTPLHLAAAWGSSPKVIRMLVNRFGEAASMQDRDGKTPLHLCCEFSAPDKTSDEAEKWRMLAVVKALLAASHDSVNIEDKDGTSALEHALCSGACDEVVLALQRASQNQWEAKGRTDGNTPRKTSKVRGAFEKFSRRASNEKEHWVNRLRDISFEGSVDVVDLCQANSRNKRHELNCTPESQQAARSHSVRTVKNLAM